MPYYNLPQSVFANPYTINKNALDASLERVRVISLYDAYITENHAIINALSALKALLDDQSTHIKFVCWCKGTAGKDEHGRLIDVPCHGDVLKRRLLQMSDTQSFTQEKLF